jgi:hypothetical protein
MNDRSIELHLDDLKVGLFGQGVFLEYCAETT